MAFDLLAIRKAAVLIRSLDATTAARLLAQLPPEQRERIGSMARELSDVDPLEQQEVLDEFLRRGSRSAASEASGVELAGSLSTLRAGVGVAPVRVEDDPPRPSPTFHLLQQSDANELAQLLSSEHPQTVALVLAHLSAEHASEVLLCLESGLQAQVLARLVDLDEVTPEALEAVQRSLTTRLQQHLHGKKRRAAGLETVRQILRAAGPLAEHELRRAIDRFDRNLARQLGGVDEDAASSATDTELTFDDLAELEAPQLRKVLGQTPAAIRTLALAGGSAAFAERCYGLLSRSQAKQLRRDLANIGPTSMRDIAAAQQAMAAVARDLLAAGAIRVPRALVESPR